MSYKIGRRVKLENLGTEIAKILASYDKNLQQEEINIMRRVCSAGAATVRDESMRITAKYAKGWAYKTEEDRLQVRGYIYHREAPGLPHLLEFGHAQPNGGRVAGRPHVSTAQTTIEENFIDSTERGIGLIGVD